MHSITIEYTTDWVDFVSLINSILFILGMWKMFDKSNVPRYWSIIPVAKKYHLAMCADREDEANVWVVSEFFYFIFYIVYLVMGELNRGRTLAGFMIVTMVIVLILVTLIYKIRIYFGLCEVYGVSKAWVFLWVVSSGLTSVIWGFSKKMMPSYYPRGPKKDIDNHESAEADTDTGMETADVAKVSHVEALENGLTINIRKRTAQNGLNKKILLKDIHLAIEPGNMVLLLGGSGAGKTTFLNAVTGYEKADATILLDGNDIYKRFDKMKYEIGLVPQQELIRQNDTVYRTLMDAAMLRLPSSVSRKERHNRVEEVMKLFGLTSVRNNIVAKQSGGQKKRISIAMEYISDPSLFILDEPDSGLDGILARELMERLHDISREGKIVIVITHTPDRAIDLFDKVIVLGKDEKETGRLVYYGGVSKAREFFGREKMEEIVKTINRPIEGGEGRADELILKYEEGRK